MKKGLALLVAAVAISVGDTAAAQDLGSVHLEVTPHGFDTEIGTDSQIGVIVSNSGSDATPPLTVHIDITDPSGAGPVDPEDWSSTLNRSIAALEPGEQKEVTWTLRPISSGTFTLYAIAIPEQGGAEIAISNGVEIRIAARRTLNPGGILPVALTGPVVVAGLLAIRERRRWRWPRSRQRKASPKGPCLRQATRSS